MKRTSIIVLATTVLLATASSVLLFRAVSPNRSLLDKNVESIVYAEEYTITPCIVDKVYPDPSDEWVIDNFCHPATDDNNVSICYQSHGYRSDQYKVCLK